MSVKPKVARVLILFLFVWTLAACGTTQNAPATTEEEENVRDIEWTRVSSGSLGQGRETPYVLVSDSLRGTDMEITTSPPEDSILLTIYRGEQSSSGYAVEVDSIRREAGEVVVALELRDPPEGAIVAQVITYPYTVVALEGANVNEDFAFEDSSGERLEWLVEK